MEVKRGFVMVIFKCTYRVSASILLILSIILLIGCSNAKKSFFDDSEKQSISNLKILYIGEDDLLVKSFSEYGAKITSSDRVVDSVDYNVLLVDGSMVEKTDVSSVKSVLSEGISVFLNDSTNSEFISRNYLDTESYEVLDNDDASFSTLLKLFNDSSNKTQSLTISYHYNDEVSKYKAILKKIIEN